MNMRGFHQVNKKEVKCAICGDIVPAGKAVKTTNNKWCCIPEIGECAEECNICGRMIPRGGRVYGNYPGCRCKICHEEMDTWIDFEESRGNKLRKYLQDAERPIKKRELLKYYSSRILPGEQQ